MRTLPGILNVYSETKIGSAGKKEVFLQKQQKTYLSGLTSSFLAARVGSFDKIPLF